MGYGDNLTLSVTASSSTTCTYQWCIGGTNIAGATGSTLTLQGLQYTNAGVYSVIVSNAAGAVGSPAAVIDVAPKLFYQRNGTGLVLNWPGTFALQASPVVTGPYADVPASASPFTPKMNLPQRFFRLRSLTFNLVSNYTGGQFFLSGPGVPGCNFIFQCSTNSTDWVNLATNPAPIAFIDSDAAQYPTRTYRVVMAQPIVNPAPLSPPSLTASPQGQTTENGSGVTLTASASGSGPLSYQWQLNGINLSGATSSSLSLSTLQFTNAGLYSVVVSNAAGTVTSPAAVLNVGAALSPQHIGNGLQLTWPSPFVLQSAVSAAGPYSDLAGAASPYLHNTAASPQGFFRLRSPPITFTTNYSGGQFYMSGPGVPGYNFIFQASTDLVHWINLQTNASPVAFVDPLAWQYPNRSYRAVIAY